jgi:hypothetical protein
MQFGEWSYEIIIGEDGKSSVRITKSFSSTLEVDLPEDIEGLPVTWIGDFAFRDSAIRTVRFPESLVGIGAGAFQDCRKLTCILFSAGLKIVRHDAFHGCRNLVRVELPEGLRELGTIESRRRFTRPGGAFEDCVGLVEIHVPDSVVMMAKNSFKGCTNLKSIRMPRHIIGI